MCPVGEGDCSDASAHRDNVGAHGASYVSPEKKTIERAKRAKRAGKAPSTQAGEFVREEIEHVREGKHGARSAKQAIAIGLSKARRSGVELPPPKEGTTSKRTRTQAKRDLAKGKRPAAKRAAARTRSAAAKRALGREGRAAVSSRALSRQAKSAAKQRGARGAKTARRATA
jgi:hypothetical protein